MLRLPVLLAILYSLFPSALAQNPSFRAFDTAAFTTNGYRIGLASNLWYQITNSTSGDVDLPWVYVGATAGEGDFNPGTPGTTTAGIQEAIDSFSRGSSNRPAGVYLKFGPGSYFYTNTIAYSNNWPYQFNVQGAGMFGTRLVYAGTATGTNTIDIKGGGNGGAALDCSGDNLWQDITLASIYCSTNVLLRITNANKTIIRNVNFSGWDEVSGIDMMSSGAAFMDPFAYTTTTNGLVAMVSGNINNWGLEVENVQVGFTAAGIESYDDHLTIKHFLSVNTGNNALAQRHTAWPTNHPYALGAAIIRHPRLDATYKGLHFYADKTGLALMNYPGGGNTEIQYIDGIVYEGGYPALSAITTNGNVWAINDPSFSSLSFGTGGRIDTNNYSTLAGAWLSMRTVVYNDPAELKRPSATGGFNLTSGHYAGSGLQLTNIPGLTPLPRQSLSTNSFVMVNSGTNNLDGIWFWNSTSSRYTNANRTGVAALVDDFSDPPNLFMTFTNAAFQLPDYLLTATFTEVSNAIPEWLDLDQNAASGTFGYFSGTTNSETLVGQRLQSLSLLTSYGGNRSLNAESSHLLSHNGNLLVTLPDIRTNAGRVFFVKNSSQLVTTTIQTVGSQLIEGASTYVIANPFDGVIIQAINGQWYIMSRTTLAPNGNGAGLTNIQEVALNWWGTNPPAGQYLASTSSNTPVWLPTSGIGGGSPGGSDTQVQFNDGGSFGGDAGLTYLKSQDTLFVGSGNSASGSRGFISGANNVIGSSGINNGFIGGGVDNFLDAGDSSHTSILGGQQNTNLSTFNGVLIGGRLNKIFAVSVGGEALLGGNANNIGATHATITGGRSNHVFGSYSIALGGLLNVVSNSYATAGGFKTRAMHEGSWVWADHSIDAETVSAGANTFNVRANGGIYLNSTNGFHFTGGPLGVETLIATNMAGDASGLTNLISTNLVYQTNLGRTDIVVLRNDVSTITTNNNVVLTGVSGVVGTEYRFQAVWFTNSAASTKTLDIPAHWRTPDGLRTYYMTNGSLSKALIEVNGAVMTNFTWVPTW